MKFEMEIGYIQNEKITVETWDFDKIEIIKDFIAFQEDHGWAVDYEAIEPDDEEDTEEEEIPAFALNAHEPLQLISYFASRYRPTFENAYPAYTIAMCGLSL